jgi:hypothetical protein
MGLRGKAHTYRMDHTLTDIVLQYRLIVKKSD